MITKKRKRRIKIKHSIRKKVFGSAERPRLSVFRSNSTITAQIIDDNESKTLANASSKSINKDAKSVNIELAKEVGKKLAEVAKEKKITQVVFDRNGYLYHGKIKALAEGAREGGLIF